MAPDQVEIDLGRNGAARGSAGCHADGPRLPGDRAPDHGGPPRRGSSQSPPRDEGLTLPLLPGMATGTVYLDVDDEITSAAARIRGSEATKVALVVPYGSRIATSRMNFRLLSREAVVNNRRLSIVASDAATRSLAASAGLPVFASVAEYDAAATGTRRLERGRRGRRLDRGAAGSGRQARGRPGRRRRGRSARGIARRRPDAPAAAAAAGDTPPTPPKPSSKSKTKAAPVSDETQKVVAPQMRTDDVAARTRHRCRSRCGWRSVGRPGVVRHPGADGPRPRHPQPDACQRSARPRSSSRPSIVLVIVVAGVAAYIFLPSAQIAVTPKEEPIPPISLTVRADPDATAIDAESGVVPAERLEVPVLVSQSFADDRAPRRGDPGQRRRDIRELQLPRVEHDPVRQHRLDRGRDPVRDASERSRCHRLSLVLPNVIPSRVNVAVDGGQGRRGGERAGERDPGRSQGRGPGGDQGHATPMRRRGGAREEFPQVSEAEVTAALETLNADLATAFAAAVRGRRWRAREHHGLPGDGSHGALDADGRPGVARRPGSRGLRPRGERRRDGDRGRRLAGEGHCRVETAGERRRRLSAGRRLGEDHAGRTDRHRRPGLVPGHRVRVARPDPRPGGAARARSRTRASRRRRRRWPRSAGSRSRPGRTGCRRSRASTRGSRW